MEEIVIQIKNLLDKLLILNKGKNKNEFNLELDSETNKLICPKQDIKLTKIEFSIMESLLYSDKHFCTYDELCKKIYLHEYDISTRGALAVALSRLRKKLNKVVIIKSINHKGVKLYDKQRIIY